MTPFGNFDKFRFRARMIAVVSAACGIGFAASAGLAQTPSVDQIIQSLQERPGQMTTGEGPAAAAGEASQQSRRKRAFSAKERIETAERVEPEPARSRPSLDLEIYFDFNSSEVTSRALPVLERLGSALVSPALQSSRFLIAGHTDAKGSASYNKALSQRRAESVRLFLIQRYKIDPARIDAIGHGKDQLKVPDNPLDPTNRRVQIVNQGQAVAQLPNAGTRK